MTGFSWDKLKESIINEEERLRFVLKDGQYESLIILADSLKVSGALLADEVGLGKTFIAIALIDEIIKLGGTCAIVVPPGLVLQWEAEIKKFYRLSRLTNESIKEVSPVKLTRFNDLLWYEGMSDSEPSPLIQVNARPLAIFSHNFNTPRISSKSILRSIHLPTLLWGKMNENSKNSSISNYWKKFKNDPDVDDKNGITRKIIEYVGNCGIKLTPDELAFLENDNFRLIQYKEDYAKKANIIQAFYKGEVGDRLTKKIIGTAIGNFNLVIVDEAHKNKDDSLDLTMLSSLLQDILNVTQNSLSRTLGLTATPVEMNARQWEFILKRIGVKKEIPGLMSRIELFSLSLDRATKNPDNIKNLETLIESSKDFEMALRGYVSRRRKIQIQSFLNLVKDVVDSNVSHPNRKYNLVSIKIDSLPLKWKNNIFAMESMSQSSKGLAIDNKIKNLDKKYASGLFNINFNPSNTIKEGAENWEIAKAARVNFWTKFLDDLNKCDEQDFFDLYDHPRIRAAVLHVEKYLDNDQMKEGHEKVLIFGTYIKPLRALRNLLNIRYVLKQVDLGYPARIKLENQNEIDLLFSEYCEDAKKDNTIRYFNKFLSENLSKSSFVKILESSDKKYSAASDSIKKYFHNIDTTEKEKFYKRLKNSVAIEILDKQGRISAFYEYLENIVLADVLIDHEMFEVFMNNHEKRKEKIEKVIFHAWDNLYSSLLENTEDNGKDDLEKVSNRVAANLVNLIATESMATGFNRSPFSRLMDGSTPMPTRRILQSQFNNSRAMPKVLIAQSMVGREGLNLHESCRKIVIFHPEWNPAVLEQQIGRVDRIDSLWEKLAQKYIESSSVDKGDFPKIEIDFIVFEGTYDEYMFNVMTTRRNNLNAQLFGALLDEVALEKVPNDFKEKLQKHAPDFSPLNKFKKG